MPTEKPFEAENTEKYDKTRDEVFFTVPLETIACSLELNIQNQTSLVPPESRRFQGSFCEDHSWQ